MYEIFPGNYAWSQAALRALFVGALPGEVLRAVERLAGAGPDDTEAWYSVWQAIAEGLATRAEQSLAAGHHLTAGSAFLRASTCLQWAVAFLNVADDRKAEGHHRSVRLFGAYAELSDPPIRYLEVPYGDTTFPAWLVLPKPSVAVPTDGLAPVAGPEGAAPGTRGAPPCVIYLPGWDSTKEQGIGLALALAERGVASLLCDGPGIGEAVLDRGLVNRPDYEVPGSAALEALRQLPGQVDPERIGVVGSSLGGYRAARFAAFEPRLRAAAIWGATWDFGRVWRRQLERPGSALPTSIDHALFVTGSRTVEEVTVRLDRWTLDGVAERISCPLLILHGANDSQIPLADAERLYDAASSRDKTLRVFTTDEGGSAHCQNDDRVLAHEAIGDWLADILAG